MKRELLSSNEAIVEAGIRAGVKLFIGYPITPVSDILERAAERCHGDCIVFQAEDELAAVNAAVGAVYAGAITLLATSGPGYSLMAEGIGFAAMVEAPIAIVYSMRAGPSTGIATGTGQMDYMHSRYCSHGDYMVVVYAPWSAQEAYDYTWRMLQVAWSLRTPTILLIDATLSHTREVVVVKEYEKPKPPRPKSRTSYKPYEPLDNLVPPMAFYGEGYRFHVESLAHDFHGFYTTSREEYERLVRRLVEKVYRNRNLIVDSRCYYTNDCNVLLVAYGSMARTCLAVVRRLRMKGVKACLWRPISVWPLDEDKLTVIASDVRKVIVAELSMGQLYREVKRVVPRAESLSIISPELPRALEVYEKVKRMIG